MGFFICIVFVKKVKEQTKTSTMERIIFFLNTRAGSGSSENLVSEIERLSQSHGFQFRIVELERTEVMKQMKREVEDFGATIAVAAGGDGTVNLLASAIGEKKIKLAIIPMGSSNGMAYQLRIPGDPFDALEVAVQGKPKEVDVLKINNRHMCLHMSDLGMNARVIHRYEDEGIRGFLGYARQYFRELKNRHKFRFSVNTDTKRRNSKAMMIVMANAAYYGTGASISPDGKIDDGWFEVVMIRAYPFWFLFYMTFSILFRNFNHNQFHRIIRCREAEIHLQNPEELQIDGEPMGKRAQVKVEILPAHLLFLIPAE